LFFWDADSETFINVADNDRSVLIHHTLKNAKSKWSKPKIDLRLMDTNKHAPGKYPFTYGGFTGRQFVTKDPKTTANTLCYKFLNNYQMKSEAWIKAQQFKLRHHKQCNFDLLYVDYDAKLLKPKRKWRGSDDDSDDEKEDKDKDAKEDKAEADAEEADDGRAVAKEGEDKQLDPSAEGQPDGKTRKVEVPAKTRGTKKAVMNSYDEPAEPAVPGKKYKKGELDPNFGLYVGRPFYATSRLSRGRYLDIVGNKLVIKTQNEFESQQWVLAEETQTIQSIALKDKSWDLHFDGEGSKGELHVWKTNSEWWQKFKYEKGYFVNVKTRKVMEVPMARDAEGQEVRVAKKSYTVNQKWDVIYVDEAAALATSGLYKPFGLHLGRPFYIQSRMPMQRVLEVVGGRNVVASSMDRARESQIFFLDPKSKTIKSVKHKDRSIDIQTGGASSNLQAYSTNARWFQLFRYENGYFINIKDKRVFDIANGDDNEGQNVMVWKRHGTLNQQFDVKYLDELKPELKKGDFFPEWGMYVGKEFSIKSKLGARYVTVVDEHSVVLKTRSSMKVQKWYFDFKSRTIKNVANDLSLDVRGKGSSQEVQLWKTNSGWW
jgi:hypothetical protein